jgi:hypothetical protein
VTDAVRSDGTFQSAQLGHQQSLQPSSNSNKEQYNSQKVYSKMQDQSSDESSTPPRLDSSSTSHDSHHRNDSSENDSRRVRYWRMIAVLVVAAAITVSTIVISIRNSQQAQFKSEFGRLTETVLSSLNQDFSNFLFCGRSLAAAVTVALQLTNQSHLELVMPPDSFDLLSNSAVVSTRSSYVSWNPLIRNDNERRIFETAVTEQEKAGLLDSKSFPPCHVCGSSEMEPSNANVQVVLPAVGSYRCSQLDAAGRTGVIPSDSCQIVSQKVQKQCACTPRPNSRQNT